ncbi:UspA domain protein [Halorhabdus utahensis DSM 12940]|uniref:UspA domain protein n=1 Tax=Halorhabdus utahensis (strain DSM 12940 / JCM 11049 / AX-2) TaxID=519442 RepID=C7NPB2_HALUD|nr:universal stress protein [Halorhabdus utahensis]ACV11699.1 UspA domain protein [Halorhabdus utahensis DSM 12940]
MAPTHVLVPLDGSPLAGQALRHALESYDCGITVLNVLTPIGSTMSEGGIQDRTEHRVAEAEDRAETMVAKAREQVGAHDQRVEAVIEVGDPAEVIVSSIDEYGVDHVVMGGHGGDSDGLVSRLLGTVATAVVTEAPVTVTVVR